MADFQQEFIRIIKERTPSDQNPVDLLTSIIGVKKEAAYRRLRHEQLFSMDEVARIATHLKISLDTLLDNKPENSYYTDFIRITPQNPFEGYYKMVTNIAEWLRKMQASSGAQKFSTSNTLPYSHIFNYPALAKLRMFKFLYQLINDSALKKMADVVIPPDITQAEHALGIEMQKIKTIYIWTEDIVSPYLADIRYFMGLGLISPEEISVLKEEMHDMMNTLEQTAVCGEMAGGVPFVVYLTDTFLDTNYIYLESAHGRASSVNVFGVNFYTSREADLCDSVKEWLDSLMRYSVLISRSGAVERTTFFRTQHSLIDKI